MMKRNAIAIAMLVCWAAQIQAAEWLTDLPQALAKARTEKKLVLMDFTGSDWCPPCKALHETVLTSRKFEDYADKNLVLVVVDFPNKTKQPKELKEANAALAKEFKIDGYPTVILLDPDRKQLKNMLGYGGETPDEFIAKLAVGGQ
jgi:thiol-disulfide isomerase/thioredoxin